MSRYEFRLADIGEGLEDAEIVQWLVTVGDQVRRDQPLVEVMTDKSNAELPAPEAGTVLELGGGVGDIITVGELIAVLDTGTNSATASPVVAPGVASEPAAAPEPITSAPSARPKASPSTRRVAADRNIDLATVHGTGPGGRILLTDLDTSPTATGIPLAPTSPAAPAPAVTPLLAAAPLPAVATPPAPTAAQFETSAPLSSEGEAMFGTVPLRGVRRAIARNMTQSWSQIPHIHAFDEIDAQPLLDLRSELRATGKPAYESVTPLTFFVAAVARALRLHPQANASINMDDDTITRHNGVNVGVAVASEQGLVVPVLHGADRLDFQTLSLTLAELVRAARDGALGPEHFRGGTVTITNFGSLGGRQATPLIRPPESCIFGFGSIALRPFVIDGQVVAHKTMPTVVGADHRLLDGDVTTTILDEVASVLAAPLRLVL